MQSDGVEDSLAVGVSHVGVGQRAGLAHLPSLLSLRVGRVVKVVGVGIVVVRVGNVFLLIRVTLITPVFWYRHQTHRILVLTHLHSLVWGSWLLLLQLDLLWLVLALALFVSDDLRPLLLLLLAAACISVAGTHHPENHEEDESEDHPQHCPGPPGHPGQALTPCQ